MGVAGRKDVSPQGQRFPFHKVGVQDPRVRAQLLPSQEPGETMAGSTEAEATRS